MAKTSIEYDGEVIEQFAADLYKRAKSIVRTYAVGFGILGLFSSVAFASNPTVAGWSALIMTIVGGAVGYSVGQSRSFQLKLDAQTALAQVQIERNTRSARSQQSA